MSLLLVTCGVALGLSCWVLLILVPAMSEQLQGKVRLFRLYVCGLGQWLLDDYPQQPTLQPAGGTSEVFPAQDFGDQSQSFVLAFILPLFVAS